MGRVYFRGINLGKVLDEYRDGAIPEKPKHKITNNRVSVIKKKDSKDDIICLGRDYNDKSQNCMYCLRCVEDGPLTIGIPLKKEYEAYHMIDIFCSIRCALAESRNRTNYIYHQSYELLNEIAMKLDISLDELPDRRLLNIFNGPMSWDQFHKSEVYSNNVGNVTFIPAKEYLNK